MVISTGRKKPHCRTCGLPMEGHKRNGRVGSPLCPSIAENDEDPSEFGSVPPLAQSSPHVKPLLHRHNQAFALQQSTPSATDFKPIKTRQIPSPRHALAIPETGPWHWRNPNWTDRHQPAPPRASSPVGSLVPTVLVDSDGHTIPPDRSHKCKSPLRREETTTSVMLMDRLTAMGKPAVSIYNTKLENISRMKSAADKLGFHSGVVHKPGDVHPRDAVEKEEDENDERVEVAIARANKRLLEREKNYSWWLVMGQSSTAVQQVIDSQQRGIPGAISDAKEMVEAPKMVTTFQLIIAGLVGGLLVVCVLSML